MVSEGVADPTKALNAGVQSLNAGAQSVNTTATSLKKIWAMVSPYLFWLLVILAVAATVYGVVKLVQWWRRRGSSASAASGPPPMEPNRLMRVRRTFLAGLPFANRTAVVDLPNV